MPAAAAAYRVGGPEEQVHMHDVDRPHAVTIELLFTTHTQQQYELYDYLENDTTVSVTAAP